MNRIRNSNGMTLLELLMGTLVIIVLIALIGVQVRGVIQRAKVSAAKATLNAWGACLAMVKDDTGLYPKKLFHLHDAEAHTLTPYHFQGASRRDWCGPYGETLSLKDPWGNEYEYLLLNDLFPAEDFEKQPPGNPYERTFESEVSPGTLIIDNPGGVTAADIKLNGEEIVSENEFKKQESVIILENVPLIIGTNYLIISVRGEPGLSISVGISALYLDKNFTFKLWSNGRNGITSGTKYDAVIRYGSF